MFRYLLIIFSILLYHVGYPQKAIGSIPPVTKADFSPVSPLVNQETDAVVLIDSGSSSKDANMRNGFFITYYKFSRILIRSKNALVIAKLSIPFTTEMNGKKLKLLRANT